MSLINDITGIGTNRHTAGGQASAFGASQQAGNLDASQTLNKRLDGIFQDTFSSTLQNVYQRGASGEFDDPTLRLQEQAAMQRLQLARQAASVGDPEGASASPSAPAGPARAATAPAIGGANAAPTASPAPSTAASTLAGAESTASGAIAVAEQRELHAVRVRQSEARLTNISTSLKDDFPLAVALPSATTGWDPETFIPKTRQEAEAFAQRMVIDATEAAARLEIVATQRDAARLEATVTGAPAAQAIIASLDEEFARQRSYVDKLARIVDTASGGAATDACASALAGDSMRAIGDITAGEVADTLRASGMDETSVERVVGAGELAAEQEQTPGGSATLKQISTATAEWTWTHRDNLRVARNREERRVDERRRQDDRRADDRRADDKQVDTRRSRRRQLVQSSQQSSRERTAKMQQANAAAQEQRAEFGRFLVELATQARQQTASASTNGA